MSGFPTGGRLAEYRGKLYPVNAGDEDGFRLLIPSEENELDFPDGFAFGEVEGTRWVQVPRATVFRLVSRKVFGRFRKIPVRVYERFLTGWDKGKVEVWYVGGDPAVAVNAGFRGNVRDGWHMAIDPENIEITEVTLTEREV